MTVQPREQPSHNAKLFEFAGHSISVLLALIDTTL